jgi:hypothetical protein
LLVLLTFAFSNLSLPHPSAAFFFGHLRKTLFFSVGCSGSSFTLAALFALLCLVVARELIQIKVQVVDFIESQGVFFAIYWLSKAAVSVSLHPLALVLIFVILEVSVVVRGVL